MYGGWSCDLTRLCKEILPPPSRTLVQIQQYSMGKCTTVLDVPEWDTRTTWRIGLQATRLTFQVDLNLVIENSGFGAGVNVNMLHLLSSFIALLRLCVHYAKTEGYLVFQNNHPATR